MADRDHPVPVGPWGAYNTNVNTLALKIAPGASGPSYVAALGAVAGVAEAIGPMIGGLVIATVRGWSTSPLLPYYIVVAIAFVLRAAATFVPGHVHEPGGVAVARMVRTMARVRSMSVEEPFANSARAASAAAVRSIGLRPCGSILPIALFRCAEISFPSVMTTGQRQNGQAWSAASRNQRPAIPNGDGVHVASCLQVFLTNGGTNETRRFGCGVRLDAQLCSGRGAVRW